MPGTRPDRWLWRMMDLPHPRLLPIDPASISRRRWRGSCERLTQASIRAVTLRQVRQRQMRRRIALRLPGAQRRGPARIDRATTQVRRRIGRHGRRRGSRRPREVAESERTPTLRTSRPSLRSRARQVVLTGRLPAVLARRRDRRTRPQPAPGQVSATPRRVRCGGWLYRRRPRTSLSRSPQPQTRLRPLVRHPRTIQGARRARLLRPRHRGCGGGRRLRRTGQVRRRLRRRGRIAVRRPLPERLGRHIFQ